MRCLAYADYVVDQRGRLTTHDTRREAGKVLGACLLPCSVIAAGTGAGALGVALSLTGLGTRA